ncbi:MAG TPA: hypothetical protein VFL93_11390 [Longimicrobiaceae bacterium]|nr:hypothetical protein [Longimicrobiaceae bacterium]
MTENRPTTVLLWAAVLLCFVPVRAGAQVAPDATWRTISTAHFRVDFPEGLEPLARRAAVRAESSYVALHREFRFAPRGKIDLVLADNADYANGYATPLPTNRIVVYAHPPIDEPDLAFYDDWVHLIVLHELVHIYQLDEAGGIWKDLRSVFGRNAVLFPEFYTPEWFKEGLAVFYESRFTHAGRIRGSRHEMVLRTAMLGHSFFPIDRATGSPVLWPGASTRYVYGSRFLDHVAHDYSPATFPRFVRRYGSRTIPYLVDATARGTIGVSFTHAWERWEDSLRTRYTALADSLRAAGLTTPEILTEAGRDAYFPRFAPSSGVIAYSAATGRSEPSTRLILPDGAQRSLGRRTSLGPTSWLPDGRGVLLGELNYVDPYRVYSDLVTQPLGGGERRLTHGARVWEADVHPDGRRAVVVADTGGTNVLALYDLATGGLRPIARPDLDVHWGLPRWSPDGRRIAVDRWTAGGLYDVVVVDSSGAVLREITRDRAIDHAPAWSPDGRYVVFSSDRTGVPNLYAFDTRDGVLRQVTNVLTGADEPDVSPDGRWIAFSYYQADGWHIARVPFDPASWRPAPPVRPEWAEPVRPVSYPDSVGGPVRPYSPWPTLRPTAWSPLLSVGGALGVGAGAAASGMDVVERHAWAAAAEVFDGGRFDGGLAYGYRGWGLPTLDLSASQDWSVYQDVGVYPSAILERDRQAGLSLTWLRRRWASVAWLRPGVQTEEIHYEWSDPGAVGGLTLASYPTDVAATLGAGYSSAHGYAFSIGPQRGFSVSGGLEGHRYTRPLEGESSAAGYVRVVGHGRGYQALPPALPGFARHVLALRADAGADAGSRSPGFSLGGTSGSSAPLPVTLDVFGSSVAFPLRGYAQGAQVGNRVVSASAEYRFPLLLVERGVRALPVFLDRFSGDLFADAGTAWCAGVCSRFANTEPRPLVSLGAELVTDVQFGYADQDIPVRVGIAFPTRTAPGTSAGQPEVYLRLGRSF